MKISYSRLKMYQTCPRLYYWRFVQNLVLPKEALPLYVGRAVHEGLAAHYSNRDPKEYIRRSFNEVRESVGWTQPELEELALQENYVRFILESYKTHWSKEPWTVLAPEVEGHINLGPHQFFFRADGVVSWRGNPWLLEHKTTSQMGPMFFKKFRNDGQITAYIYCVWKKLGVRPVGAIINAIRKSRKLDRVEFGRDVVTRSPERLEMYMDQVQRELDALERLTALHADDPSQWFMHTGECVSYNRECDYVDLCTKDTPDVRGLYVPRKPDYIDLGGKDETK